MKSALALFAVTAVFVVGTVVGAMGKHLYDAHHGSCNGHAISEGADGGLDDMLDLTAEQRVAVERIMHDAHGKACALHDRLLPEVTAHMAHVHERINEVLSPEQRNVFAELRERHDSRMQHMLLAGPSLDCQCSREHDEPPHESNRN